MDGNTYERVKEDYDKLKDNVVAEKKDVQICKKNNRYHSIYFWNYFVSTNYYYCMYIKFFYPK